MNDEEFKNRLKQAGARIKLIVLGEEREEDLFARNGETFIVSDCLFCDTPVWVNKLGVRGVTTGKSDEYIPRDAKALHKLCFLAFEMGSMAVMRKNLQQRGEL